MRITLGTLRCQDDADAALIRSRRLRLNKAVAGQSSLLSCTKIGIYTTYGYRSIKQAEVKEL